MTIAAKSAYLTALIGQSQQREAQHETSLAGATTRHDTQASRYRLEQEQARQGELRAERAALPA